MTDYYVGIDGGGSNLRVALVTDAMQQVTVARRATANPSVIGRDASAALIVDALQEAIRGIDAAQIRGVGIGVAGASAVYASAWLRSVVESVLPGVHLAPSSDNEIALVGAVGERRGLLLLAGTGSVAFGINERGESLQTGGWGYLLGDQGGGYWMGNHALRAIIHAADEQPAQTPLLVQRVMQVLGFSRATDVVQWLYTKEHPVPEVAKLAPHVLDCAEEGDPVAVAIVEEGVRELIRLAEIIQRRLQMPVPRFAFAGGILTAGNPLSRKVVKALGLPGIPQPLYEPMIGAALLARITKHA